MWLSTALPLCNVLKLNSIPVRDLYLAELFACLKELCF